MNSGNASLAPLTQWPLVSFLLPNFLPSISSQTKGCLMDQLPAIPHFSTRGKFLSSHMLLVQSLPKTESSGFIMPCCHKKKKKPKNLHLWEKPVWHRHHPLQFSKRPPAICTSQIIKRWMWFPKIPLPFSCICTTGILIPLSLYLKGESLEVDVLQI